MNRSFRCYITEEKQTVRNIVITLNNNLNPALRDSVYKLIVQFFLKNFDCNQFEFGCIIDAILATTEKNIPDHI